MKPIAEVRGVLRELARKVSESEMYYHSVNVCIALNGLQSVDDSIVEVKELLTALMDKAVAADEQGIDRAVDREISMALFGLQKMGSGGKRTNGMYSTKCVRPSSVLIPLPRHYQYVNAKYTK